MPRTARAALLALALTLAPPAMAGDDQVHAFRLDNGMTVLVKPQTRAPVVINQLWFPVGSSHETPGTTGVAHALEHMMFKGTEAYDSGEFSRLIAAEGGRSNAFTGRDFTGYYEELQADRLDLALELGAERLARIRLKADEFERELEVVKEERRLRVDDSPVAALRERFNAVAWHHSPYRQPIIGWPGDLEQLTLDDIEAWYRDWYGVNNATLVVVGDVDPETVREQVEHHFGPLEPRETPQLKARPEVEPRGKKRLEVHHDNATPYVMIGYQAPSLATADDTDDAYALMVLSRILSGGRSARLPDRLVRGQEIAASAAASYHGLSRLDTLFMVQGQPASEAGRDGLEAALREEITAIREDGVEAAELERARVQLRADHVYRLDSLSGQAMEIGLLEVTGIGHEALETFEERLAAVTAEDVQRAARRYLVEERMTVGHLIRPDDADGEPETPQAPDPAGSGPGAY